MNSFILVGNKNTPRRKNSTVIKIQINDLAIIRDMYLN